MNKSHTYTHKCTMYKTQKFKHLIFFFATELCESFIHFGYQPLIRYMICKNILAFGSCLLILRMISFAKQKLVSLK